MTKRKRGQGKKTIEQHKVWTLLAKTRDAQLERGKTTTRAVGEHVLRYHRSACVRMSEYLMETAVFNMAGEVMKQITLTVVGAESQIQLPFNLRDLPGAISFPEKTKKGKTEIQWVYLTTASKAEIVAHHAMLRKQIAADTRRADAVGHLIEQLTPIWEQFPEANILRASEIYTEQHAQKESA